MTWSNNVIFQFIDIYHGEPAIWDPNHPLHKNKLLVSEAWNRIAEKMGVPVPELKRKKETLMAAFRLNHKKKLASMKSGDPEDVFTPIWVFYDRMAAFLSELYDYRPNNTHYLDDASSSSSQQEKWSSANEVGIEQLLQSENSPTPHNNDTSNTVKPVKQIKRRHSEISDSSMETPHSCDTFLVNTLTSVTKIISELKNDEEDECDLFGKLTAMKLRKLPQVERWALMYEIDGLFLQRLMKNEPREFQSLD